MSVVFVDEVAARKQLTLLDFMSQRFAHVSRDEWQQRFAEGKVHDEVGNALHAQAVCKAQQKIVYYRSVPHEVRVPFEARVLYMNAHIVIADKPHFLPVIPTGRYVRETLLARLKALLHNEALAPVHRIDRDTAGLVMFSLVPATRRLYQALFRERRIKKVYEAIAPVQLNRPLPLHYASRLAPAAHFMQMHEVAGEPNALTDISLVEQRGAHALYQLQPLTGKRHQLRVQMNALGMPIVNDGLYPMLTPERAADDFSKPLMLLAKSLAFTDPVTQTPVHISSQLKLQWP